MQIIDRIVEPIVHVVQVRTQSRELCYEVDGCFITACPMVVQLPERIDTLPQSVYVRSHCADELVHSLLARRHNRHCATVCRNVCKLSTRDDLHEGQGEVEKGR